MHSIVHAGSCHCGAVRFEVDAPEELVVYECNCSICGRVGFQHLIVESENFRLTSGAESLTSYRFNSHTANHLFCRVCGVKSFYVPRSHPAGYSANYRCLDPATVSSVEIRPFDGQNWEEHVGELEG